MALADIVDNLRDSVLRPRNVLPAVVAVGFGVLAWVGIGPLLLGEDEPPPLPVVDTAPAAPELVSEPPPEPEPPQVYAAVLVARLPLAAGTLIEPRHVEWKDWLEPPDEQYIVKAKGGLLGQPVIDTAADVGVEGFGTGPFDRASELTGALTTQRFGVGEPLRWEALIGADDPGYLPRVLKPGFRAVAVEGDRATNTAGLVRIGDRVDVILVATTVPGAPPEDAGPVAQAIVRDVRVVGVGRHLFPDPDAGVPEGNTLTLEVRPRDAARLSLARATGSLSLVIRSSSDPGPASALAAVRMDDVVASTRPERQTTTLRVLRGTQTETIVLRDDGAVTLPEDRPEES